MNRFGETLMRHHHSKPTQFELFGPSDMPKIKAIPDWRKLPFQTREVVTGLMARLLMEHAQEPAREEDHNAGEVDDE
jgi:hypothetical protein